MPHSTREKKLAYLRNRGYALQASNKREASREKWHRLRNQWIAENGGRCVQCGFADPRALQIDHVFGDGRKDRRGRGPSFVIIDIWLPENRGKYQVLCANCNQIKRVENKEIGGPPRKYE